MNKGDPTARVPNEKKGSMKSDVPNWLSIPVQFLDLIQQNLLENSSLSIF